jgi:hypothetical protein
VRELALQKMAQIEQHLAALGTLRAEWRRLTHLCRANLEDCPILNKMDKG